MNKKILIFCTVGIFLLVGVAFIISMGNGSVDLPDKPKTDQTQEGDNITAPEIVLPEASTEEAEGAINKGNIQALLLQDNADPKAPSVKVEKDKPVPAPKPSNNTTNPDTIPEPVVHKPVQVVVSGEDVTKVN
jgi:hypothetical protein